MRNLSIQQFNCDLHELTECIFKTFISIINPLAPNDVYIRCTAQLNSRHYILNIYSTNILTEYFKHAAHSSFVSLQDATLFGSCNIHILNTGCAKILKKIPASKG